MSRTGHTRTQSHCCIRPSQSHRHDQPRIESLEQRLLLAGDIDLLVTDAQSPSAASSHETIPISWTIRNDGPDRTTRAILDRVYLSDDDLLDNSDQLLISRSAQFDAPLGSGESYTAQRNVRIPARDTGDYFLLFETDSTSSLSTDIQTANNLLARAIDVTSSDVDLGVTQVTAPAEVDHFQFVTFDMTVTNTGSEVATGNWIDRIYSSSDPILDDSDLLLNSFSSSTFSPLAAGESYRSEGYASWNSTFFGAGYVLFVTNWNDGQSESDSSNNVLAQPINVQAGNLAVSDVDLTLGTSPHVSWNLTVEDVTSIQATQRVFISEDNTLDENDTLVYTTSQGDVSGIHEFEAAISLTSVTTDEWSVFVVADPDNTKPESNENDNTGFKTVTVQRPDLVPTNLSFNAPIIANDNVLLSWSVENIGVGDATINRRDEFYLSNDGILDDEDDLLFSVNVPNSSLASGATNDYSSEHLFRYLDAGNYTLFLKTNNNGNQFESDFSNNILSTPLTITAPDLAIQSVEAPGTASMGERITIDWTVENSGSVATLGSWSDRVYLSEDIVLDPDDRFVASFSRSSSLSLAPSESYDASREFNLSASAPGDYHLIFVANENTEQGEDDRSNNTLTTPISITAPNLVPTSLTTPTSTVSSEQNIELTWTIENQGDVAALGFWYDAIYLSDDTTLDSSDKQLATQYAGSFRPLDSQASYTATREVVLSQATAGIQYVLVRADGGSGLTSPGAQIEMSEDDNVIALEINVSVPNIVIESATGPSQAASAETIQVSWTGKNDSLIETAADWTDYIYLSHDQLFDLEDRQLTSSGVGSFTPLAPGATYSTSRDVRLRNISSGDYYILVVANANYRVAETNDYDNVASFPIRIDLPDVIPTVLDAPEAAVLGQTISVSWTVENITGFVASGDWTDRIYLSTDDQLSVGEDISVGSRSASSQTPLPPGGNYELSTIINLRKGFVGTNYLILDVSPGTAQLESSKLNNRLAVPIELTAPDLLVESVTAPTSAIASETVEISYVVRNIGSVNAPADWSDEVYISDDNQLDASDIKLHRIRNGTRRLDPDETYTITENVTLRNVQPGNKFLLVAADDRDGQPETDETNNVFAHAIEISAPDLTPINPVAPAILNLGDNFDISWTTQNIGDVIAPATWYDDVYLSADPIVDSSDKRLFEQSQANDPPLGPGESRTTTRTVLGNTIGTRPSGNYYLLFRIDTPRFGQNNQVETNEDNNFMAVQIELQSPDLVPVSINAPDSVRPGDQVTISWTAQNQGEGVAARGWEDFLAISDDQDLSCPYECGEFDIDYVDSGDHSPLAAGESYTQSLTVTIPSSSPYGDPLLPGEYFLGVQVAHSYGSFQPESNKSNNQFFIPITIVPPDVDLVVTNMTAPDEVFPGQSITVSVTVENQGTETATETWYDRAFYSVDENIGGGDVFLTTYNAGSHSPLPAGSSYTYDLEFEIPARAEAGTAHISLSTDYSNQQAETDITNNTSFFPITVEAPNLIITDFTAPSAAGVSQSVQLSWTVKNDSLVPAQGPWTDRVYLSDNSVFDSGDRFLGSFAADTFLPLVPQGNYTQNRSVQIPNVPAGSRFIIVIADSQLQQGESNNDDNVSILPITIATADLRPTSVSSVSGVTVGETITVNFTVLNEGIGPTGTNWSDFIYLSTDTVINSGDSLLGGIASTPLNNGSTYTRSESVSIPNVDPGNYYLILKTDGTNRQSELDEADNQIHTAITVVVPDLTVSSGDIPDGAISNESITLNYTVENISNNVAARSWSDHVYLSEDNVLDTGDRLLATPSAQQNIPLAGQESYSVELDVELPALTPGSYFLFVKTNASGEQRESDSDNNSYSEAIEITAPNLRPTDISTVPNALVNETIDVTFSAINDSSVAALSDWRDYIYLSDDNTLDSNDRFLTSFENDSFSELPGGSGYTVILPIIVPGDVSGDKFILVEVNGSNQQGESDYSDNVFSTPLTIAAPPNLTVDILSAPSTAAVGEEVEITYQVTNAGPVDALADWSDGLRMRTADVPDGDVFYTFSSAAITDQTPLAPGESYTVTTSVQMPVQVGDFFLEVRTNQNNVQGEADYGDNSATQAVSLQAPDLVVALDDASPIGVLGQGISVTYTVTNIGNVQAVLGWNDTVYLSHDPSGLSLDQAVATTQRPNILGPGESYSVSVNPLLPAFDTGSQYLIVRTNSGNGQQEVDATNNSSSVLPIELRAGDLSVSEITPSTDAISGQAFNVTWTVTNTGNAAVSNWNDRVSISIGGQISSAIPVGEFQFLGTLQPGESVTRTQGVVPPVSANGDYFVIVQTDSQSDVIESDESNNARVDDDKVSIELAPVPNLTVSNVALAITEVDLFEQFEVTWVVNNIGTGATNASYWRDEVYLSIDEVLDSTDVLVGRVGNESFLNEGESYANRAVVRAPRSVSEGDYFVLVKTDASGNRVSETFGEADNVAVGPQIAVNYPLPPDLVVSNVSAPETAFSGQSMMLSYTVTNDGDALAWNARAGGLSADWTDYIYMSDDEVFDAGDQLIGSHRYRTLYYLVQTVTYTGEYEECFGSTAPEPTSVPLFWTGRHDLSSVFEIRNRLFNSYTSTTTFAACGNIGSQLLALKHTSLDYAQTNDPLEPGESYTVTRSVLLPSDNVGDYYFFVQTDATDRLFEFAFDQNNTGYDSNTVTHVNLTPPPDLEIAALTIPSAGVSGRTIEVNYQVGNFGATATPHNTSTWRDKFYLSVDNQFDPEIDQLIASATHRGVLATSDTYERTFNLKLPNGLAGDYFVFAVADGNDNVFELDNGNNLSDPQAITLSLTPPDLVVTALSVEPESILAGGSTVLTWTVENQGTGSTIASHWTDMVMLSVDSIVGNDDDIVLASYHRYTSLNADASYEISRTLALPYDLSGSINLYVRTDRTGRVDEFLGENNNVSQLIPLEVLNETADLSVTLDGFATTNGRIEVGWTVENVGVNKTSTNAWRDAIVASTNDILGDGDDLLLSRVYHAGRLNVGQRYSVTRQFDVPFDWNEQLHFFVVTDADSKVTESGQTSNNNVLAGLLDTSTLHTFPDLVVLDVTAPMEGLSGQLFDMSWTIRNVGDPMTNTLPLPPEYARGSWSDVIYLSQDQIFDPVSDIYLGRTESDVSLFNDVIDEASNTVQEYTRTGLFRVPSGLAGPFYLLVVTDRNNNVTEVSAENNNIGLDTNTMFVSLIEPADLIVGTVNVPPASTPGSQYSVTYVLENQGLNPARGAWTDRLYLSVDDQFSLDDTPLGRRFHSPRFTTPATIAAGESAEYTVSSFLPAVVPGDYHIVLRTDVFNTLPESDDKNNIGASLESFQIGIATIELTNGSGEANIEMIVPPTATRSVYFQIEFEDGQTISLEAIGNEIDEVNQVDIFGVERTFVPRQSHSAIYIAHDRVPTPFDYDVSTSSWYRASGNNFSSEPTIISRTSAGIYYVRVDIRDTQFRFRRNIFSTQENFDIHVTELPFTVTGISPATVGNTGPSTLEVTASNFNICSEVDLAFEGTVVRQATDLRLRDNSSGYVTIDLEGLNPGSYELQLHDHGGGFATHPIEIQEGAGANVDASLHGPGSVRISRQYVFYANYGNNGDSDGIAPLLIVSSPDGTPFSQTRETLPANEIDPGTSIMVMGLSNEGEAGVLRPDELGSIPFFFSPQTFESGGFTVQTVTADDLRPFVFDEFESEMRPEGLSQEQWESIRPALSDRLGTTWGSYVRALSQAATRLDDIGQRTNDVRSIFRFMVFSQLNPITNHLSGHVVAAEDCRIIPEPFIRAFADGVQVSASTYTDAGMFSIPELELGTYALMVDADGRARTVVESVKVTESGTELIIEMAPESVIHGIVAPEDGASEGFTYIRAQRLDLPYHPAGQFAYSSDSLEFRLDSLPAGDYEVTIGRTGHSLIHLTTSIGEGEELDLGEIALSLSGGVRGSVISDTSSFDSTTAIVGVVSDGEVIASRLVDSNGQFAIDGIASGSYTLRVLNNQTGFSTEEVVEVMGGEVASPVTLRVVSGAIITGHIIDPITSSGVEGMLVIVHNDAGELFRSSTDESGLYHIAGINQGDYFVTAGATTTYSRALHVDDIGETEYTLDFELSFTTVLQGTVTDGSSNPLPGAVVSLISNGNLVATSRTDEIGAYRFFMAHGGVHDVLVSSEGASFEPQSQLAVADGEETELNFVSGSESLEVTVTGGGGGNEQISIALVSGLGPIISGSQSVPDEPSVTFEDLVPGLYEIRVTTDDGFYARGSVTVTAGADNETTVTLLKIATVSGQITDENGEPIAFGTITYYPHQPLQSPIHTISAEDGSFAVEVVPGTYDIVYVATGYQTIVETGSDIAVSDTAGPKQLLPATTVVSGTITNTDGNSVSLGAVYVRDSTGRTLGESTLAGDGTYSIAGVAGSDLNVTVWSPGMDVGTTELSISDGETVDVDIVLSVLAVGVSTPDPNLLESNIQIFESLISPSQFFENVGNAVSQFLVSLTNGFVGGLGHLLGEEAEKSDDHVTISDIPNLPAGCVECSELEIGTILLEISQKQKYWAWHDATVAYSNQIAVANTLAVLKLLNMAGKLASIVTAVNSLASSAVTSGGTLASGVPGTSSTVLGVFGPNQVGAGLNSFNTLVGIANDTQSLIGKTNNLINAAVGKPADKLNVGNEIFTSLTTTRSLLAGILSSLQYTFSIVGNTVNNTFGAIGLVTNIITVIDAILNPLQQFKDELAYLSELETNMITAKGAYELSLIQVNNSLSAYLACLAINECEDDDENGNGNGNNGNNGNNNNDDDDGNPPSPPNPPTPPNQFNYFVVIPKDPNDIIGPEGFGEEGWISSDEILPYMIRFENVPEATAPAQRVTIEQQLDENLDPRTFRVDDFGWGDQRIELEENQSFFQGRIDVTDGSGMVVDVTATVDVLTGLITWIFQTIDVTTGDVPLDALAGFLPANQVKGEGEGFVTYTVRARRDSVSGTRIDAKATIVFDTNEPIDTPPIFNTLDASAPVSRIESLPNSVAASNFVVRWDGQDGDNGSALKDYSVYVSENGGPLSLWLQNIDQNEAVYEGVAGKSYGFSITSRDNAGNNEELKATVDTVTQTPGASASIGDMVWLDANGDGIFTTDETGFSGIGVNLLDSSGILQNSTTTDSFGIYGFSDLNPLQSYVVEIEIPANFAASPSRAGADSELDSDISLDGRTTPMVVQPGDNNSADAGLVPLGAISGVVWNDSNDNSIRDAGESGLEGWVVFLDLDENGLMDATEPGATTDNGGVYELPGLTSGQYTVSLLTPEGWSQTFPGVAGTSSVAVKVGQDANLHFGGLNNTSLNLINASSFLAEPSLSDAGSPQSVVIIDSGIDIDHPAFGLDNDHDGIADRIVYQYDFADDDNDASDHSGHGSLITSIVAGEIDEYKGIASHVDIIALKVFSNAGYGSMSYVEQALQWVSENATRFNIAAVNLSVGDGKNWTSGTSLYGIGDELAALSASGIIVVSAAGNNFGRFDSAPGVQYPAADPHTISVGAVWDADRGDNWFFGRSGTDHSTGADQITSFSQRAPEMLDVFAPGGLVYGANAYGGKMEARGTSQATSFVTGAAVLAQQEALELYGRQLTTGEFRQLLELSSDSIMDGDDEDDNVHNTMENYNRLNLQALIDSVAHLGDLEGLVSRQVSSNSSDQLIGQSSGLPFAYSINLDVGEQRTDVDFGVADKSAPVFDSVPDNVTVPADTVDGSDVAYQVPSASDTVDPMVDVVCTPQSGLIFPIGDTTVECIATDASGNSETVTFDVTVLPFNDGLRANDDTLTLDEDTTDSVNVLSNDDASTPLTVVSFTQPDHGEVTEESNGVFRYEPSDNYAGLDSFDYVVEDQTGQRDSATVDLTVIPKNDPPVAKTDTAVVNQNRAVRIDVINNDSDIDNDKLKVLSVTQPDHGSVRRIRTGEITYRPAANYYGEDVFTYVVTDQHGGQHEATVTVQVEDNRGPRVSNIRFVTRGNLLKAIVVQFNEDVTAESAVDQANYELYRGRIAQPLELRSISYEAETNSAVLMPLRKLKGDQAYKLIIKDGISDLSGNILDGNRDGISGGESIVRARHWPLRSCSLVDGEPVDIAIDELLSEIWETGSARTKRILCGK